MAGVIFHYKLGDENRVREIWKRVIKSLALVHSPQRIEVGFGVGANRHQSEYAVAQEWVRAAHSFSDVERGGSRRNPMCCESGLRRV